MQAYIHHSFHTKSVGRIALTSCSPLEKAVEDRELGHGLYTHHLLTAFKGEGPPEVYPYGWLTVGSLFAYLCRQLPESQRPVLAGVQFDEFKLIYYQDKTYSQASKQHDPLLSQKQVREIRLRALIADH